jgi:hypothetical protein
MERSIEVHGHKGDFKEPRARLATLPIVLGHLRCGLARFFA